MSSYCPLMFANRTPVLVGLSASALTWNLLFFDTNTAPRGTLVLKKSGGSRFGADCASGVPSQLISRRPAAAGGLLPLSGSPSRPRKAVTVGVRPATSPAAPSILLKENMTGPFGSKAVGRAPANAAQHAASAVGKCALYLGIASGRRKIGQDPREASSHTPCCNWYAGMTFACRAKSATFRVRETKFDRTPEQLPQSRPNG